MSTYDKIAWLPLCGGLTGLGLVLSFFVMRRRGMGSGLRWAAWSLLPLAAYLTGSIEMFWKMGVAIGDFAKGFVFSPRVWSGIALAGLAVVLFIVSGPLRRRRCEAAARTSQPPSAGPALGAPCPLARAGEGDRWPPVRPPRCLPQRPPRAARARTLPTMMTT